MSDVKHDCSTCRHAYADDSGVHCKYCFRDKDLPLYEPRDEDASKPDDASVDHPSHYTWLPNGIEVIDITQHLNFCMGNAIKYILRADHKGKPIEDLKKARKYIDFELRRRGVHDYA